MSNEIAIKHKNLSFTSTIFHAISKFSFRCFRLVLIADFLFSSYSPLSHTYIDKHAHIHFAPSDYHSTSLYLSLARAEVWNQFVPLLRMLILKVDRQAFFNLVSSHQLFLVGYCPFLGHVLPAAFFYSWWQNSGVWHWLFETPFHLWSCHHFTGSILLESNDVVFQFGQYFYMWQQHMLLK